MKNKILILILLLPLLFCSCGKWLEVKPFDQISEDELMKSEEGFQKLLNGIYIELNHKDLYGSALSVEMIEMLGGAYEIGTANVWGNYTDLKTYNYGTEFWRDRLDRIWNKAYALILNCNKILENMESRKSLFTGINYEIIRGEATALRAMLHFDMLRMFGPVYSQNPDARSIPYYSSVTLTPNSLLPASEVMENVLRDLAEARNLLISDPVITEGVMMTPSGGGSVFLRYRTLRLNYFAVTGLLARANLYAGQRKAAMAYALEIIRAGENGIFPFVDRSLVVGSPKDPDRIFSSEVLFALTHAKRNQLFLDYFSPNRTTFTCKMEPNLISNVIFGGGTATGGSQDDYRNQAMWSMSGANKYFYKYADMVEPGKIENTMIPLLRLGEIYLIAAESQSDILANGTSYVNTLRRNRGISSSISQLTPELLKYEYIREVYGEGQLFFMYKRLFSTIIRSASADQNIEPSNNVFVIPCPDSEKDN